MSSNMTCLDASNAIALWTVLFLITPNIFNCASILLIISIALKIKKFKSLKEDIASNTNWLARTARRVSFGPTAKLALLNYAGKTAEINRHIQIVPLPAVKPQAFQAIIDSSTMYDSKPMPSTVTNQSNL
ncbi:unnamed protein product [Thelazia callipaeda]|uniref:Transmembrane protein n=1 Tax=Thelazia callipaeda TaxID=103827 RepID=A0A0N5D7Q1_THECL|nr:unnamed protein product [Thelazia callipaeda]